jgi:hypothetical protein
LGIFLAYGVAGPFLAPDLGSRVFFVGLAVFGFAGIVRAGVTGAEARGGRVITRTLLVTHTYSNVVRVDVEEGPISGGRVDGAYVVLCLADGRRIELKEQLSTYRWAERRNRTVTKQAYRLAQALNVPGPGNGGEEYPVRAGA